jgi:dipeptidyl aminopeptidase/acylaminoacyl peptidase
MDFKDVMSGIDCLAAQRLCDNGRMGVHGFSYGAILGAYTIGKTTLFRAAVFLSGRYDWHVFCGSSYGEFDTGFANSMGGTPWKIPQVYYELSATSHVAKVEAPVLLLHGEEDALCQNAPALYTAYLRGAGKEVEFVLYRGAGHSLNKVSQIRDRWERTLCWFRKYLYK